MEMAGLSNSIIEFLLLTSILVSILGAMVSFVQRVLKIQGTPKIWIYALLFILPLVYPIQTLLPDQIRLPVPMEMWQLFDSDPSEKAAGEVNVSENVSLFPADTAVMYQDKGEEKKPVGHKALYGNFIIRFAETVSESPVNWKLTALLVWLVVSLYFMTRLSAKIYKANRFSKLLCPVTNVQVLELYRKCMADTGLRRPPRLLTLDHLPSPAAMGFLRPRILLPKRLLEPEFREGLRFALLHELKHVHQHHNWWLLVESIIGAVYFFHPVIFWAKKRIHEELEYICDSHVVKVTNKSISYADFLLHEIWRQKGEKDLVLALPFISRKTKTTNRVRSILENTRPSLFTRIRGVFALCFIFFTFISLLLCNVAPSAQDQRRKPHELALAMAENRSNVSFNIRIGETEIESGNQLKRPEVIPEGDPSFGPPADQSAHDVTAVSEQRTVSTDRADLHKGDVLISSREIPEYARVSKKKGPHIPLEDTGTLSENTISRQSMPGPIQAGSSSRLTMNSADIILLAQNETSTASISNSIPIPETRDTNPDLGNVLFHMQLGTAHHREGRFNQAIAEYSKVIEIDADYVVAYINRGDANYRMFRYAHAIFDFDKAIALSPDNAGIYYTRGSIYYRIGKIKKAVSDFNKAVGLNPGYIKKMPEGIMPDPSQEDTNYTSYAAESLKSHHGSLPPGYWDKVEREEC